MKSLLSSNLILFFLFFAFDLNASPWNPKKGESLLITSFSREKQNYDDYGNKTKRRTELNPYYEYGITNELAFILNHTTKLHEDTNHKFDTKFSLKQHIAEYNNKIFATQLTISIPLGYEVRLMIGENNSLFGRPTFTATEIGYGRWYEEEQKFFQLDNSFGINLNDNFMLLSQNFLKTDSKRYFLENKLQMSLVYNITEKHSAQVGYFYKFSYDKFNADRGILLSYWFKF